MPKRIEAAPILYSTEDTKLIEAVPAYFVGDDDLTGIAKNTGTSYVKVIAEGDNSYKRITNVEPAALYDATSNPAFGPPNNTEARIVYLVPSPITLPTFSLFHNRELTGIVPHPGDVAMAELGVIFKSDVDCKVLGIKLYRVDGTINEITGHLYDTSTGVLLGSTQVLAPTQFTNWQYGTFATPIDIISGKEYTATTFLMGVYAATPNFFDVDYISGHLTAPTLINGVFGDGISMPVNTLDDTNYWVDVVCTSGSITTNRGFSAGFNIGFG